MTPDDDLNTETIARIQAEIAAAEAALVILSRLAAKPSEFGRAMHTLARDLGGWITHHRITLEQWQETSHD